MMNDPNPNNQVNTRVDDLLNPPIHKTLHEALTESVNGGLTDSHDPHPCLVSQDGDDPASTPVKTPSQDAVTLPRATTGALSHSPGRTFNGISKGTHEVRSEIRSEVRSEIHSETTGWTTVVDTLAAVLAAGLVLAVGLPWGEALPPVPARVASVLRSPEVVPAGQSGNEEQGKQTAHGARLTPMARVHALTMTGLGVSAVEATGLAVATTPMANPGALGETEAPATGRADEANNANNANEAVPFEAFSPFASSLPSAVNVVTDNTPTHPTVRVIGRLVLTQGIPLTTHDPDWVSTLEADAKDAVRSGEWAKALENAEATFRRQWDAPPGVTMGMLTFSRRETYPTPYAQWKQHQGGAEVLAKRSVEANGDPVQMALSTFSRTYLFIDTDNPVQAAFFERFVTGAEPLLKELTERLGEPLAEHLGRHPSTNDAGVETVLNLTNLRIVFVKGNLAQWRDRLASLNPNQGTLPLPLYFDQGGSLATRLHVTALPTFVHLTAEVMDLWTPALTADGNSLDPLPDGWGVWPTGVATESTASKTTNVLPTQEAHHE